jgi:hypothetical protein
MLEVYRDAVTNDDRSRCLYCCYENRVFARYLSIAFGNFHRREIVALRGAASTSKSSP